MPTPFFLRPKLYIDIEERRKRESSSQALINKANNEAEYKVPKKKDSIFGKAVKATAGFIPDPIEDKVLKPAVTALGAAQKYIGKPLAGPVLDEFVDDQGKFSITPGNLMRGGLQSASPLVRTGGMLLRGKNPYAEGVQGYDEFEQSNAPLGLKTAVSGISDPTMYFGPGLLKGALKFAPEAAKASLPFRAAAGVLEQPGRVTVGSIAGSAIAANEAERRNLSPGATTALTLGGTFAGGGVGGVGVGKTLKGMGEGLAIAQGRRGRGANLGLTTEVVKDTNRLHHASPFTIEKGKILVSRKGDIGRGHYVSLSGEGTDGYEISDPINVSGLKAPISQEKFDKAMAIARERSLTKEEAKELYTPDTDYRTYMKDKTDKEGGQQVYRYKPTRDLFMLHWAEPIDQVEASRINNALKDRNWSYRVKKGMTGREVYSAVGKDPDEINSDLSSVLNNAGFDGMTNGDQYTIWRPNEVLEADLTPPEYQAGAKLPTAKYNVPPTKAQQSKPYAGDPNIEFTDAQNELFNILADNYPSAIKDIENYVQKYVDVDGIKDIDAPTFNDYVDDFGVAVNLHDQLADLIYDNKSSLSPSQDVALVDAKLAFEKKQPDALMYIEKALDELYANPIDDELDIILLKMKDSLTNMSKSQWEPGTAGHNNDQKLLDSLFNSDVEAPNSKLPGPSAKFSIYDASFKKSLDDTGAIVDDSGKPLDFTNPEWGIDILKAAEKFLDQYSNGGLSEAGNKQFTDVLKKMDELEPIAGAKKPLPNIGPKNKVDIWYEKDEWHWVDPKTTDHHAYISLDDAEKSVKNSGYSYNPPTTGKPKTAPVGKAIQPKPKIGHIIGMGGEPLDLTPQMYAYSELKMYLKQLLQMEDNGTISSAGLKQYKDVLKQLDDIGADTDMVIASLGYHTKLDKSEIGSVIKKQEPKPVSPEEIIGNLDKKDPTVDDFIALTEKTLGKQNMYGDAKSYAAPGQEGSPITGMPNKNKPGVTPVKKNGMWTAAGKSYEDLGDLMDELVEAGYKVLPPEGMGGISSALRHKIGNKVSPMGDTEALFEEMRKAKPLPGYIPEGEFTIDGKPMFDGPRGNVKDTKINLADRKLAIARKNQVIGSENRLAPRPETHARAIGGGAFPEALVTPNEVKVGLTKGETIGNQFIKVKKAILQSGHGVLNQSTATPIAKEYLRINNIMKNQATYLGKIAQRFEKIANVKSIEQIDIDKLSPEATRVMIRLQHGMDAYDETLKQFDTKFAGIQDYWDKIKNDQGQENKTFSDVVSEYGNAIANKVSDRWLGTELKKLGLDLSNQAGVNIPGKTISIAGSGKIKMPLEIADVIKQAFDKVHPTKSPESYALFTAINNTLRGLWAAGDLSRTFIQQLPFWFDNPKKASESFMFTRKILKDPTVAAEWMLRYDEKAFGTDSPTIIELTRNGLHMAQDTGEGSDIAGLPGKVQRAPFGIGATLRRTNAAFAEGGNIDRILMADMLWEQWKDGTWRMWTGFHTKGGKTITDASTRKEVLEAIGRAANRSTGYAEKGFGGPLGSALFFAPRFMQSQFETVMKAAWGGGIESQVARRQLLKLIAVGTGLTYAMNEARGEETIWDPRDSNFLRIRNVAGADLSIFGPWDTLARGIIRSVPHPDETGDWEMGDPTYLVRSKLSPVLSVFIDTIMGENVIKQKVWDFKKPTSPGAVGHDMLQLRNLLAPFSLRKVGEEPVSSTAFGFFGGKGSPLTNTELLDNKLEAAGIKKSDPNYLIDRKQYLADHPEIIAKADKGSYKRTQEIQQDITNRRQTNADKTTSNEQSLVEFRGNRKLLLTEQRNRLDEVIKEDTRKANTEQKKWINSYFDLFEDESNQDPITGEMNPDTFDEAVAEWTNKHGSQALDFVNRYMGAGLNPVERAYNTDLRKLDAAGYFDLPKYQNMKSDLDEDTIDSLASKVDSYRVAHPKESGESWALSARKVLKESLDSTEMLDIINSRKDAFTNPARAAIKKQYPKEVLWFNSRANWDSYTNYQPGVKPSGTTSNGFLKPSIGGALKGKLTPSLK